MPGCEVWILGSSGGESATVAGHRGLPFAANYHVAPASVLDAVDGYRAAFRPSDALARPYVAVSADVVVAETDDRARELATGYGLWVRSIRTGAGRHPVPDARRGRRLRLDRRGPRPGPGPPRHPVRRLPGDGRRPARGPRRRATGADELVVTTITHDHADRVRSYELLAAEWARRTIPSAVR